jgi:uncharacterized membrane protein
MKFWAVGYLATGVAMLIVDAVWLTVMGKALYRPILGDILLDQFRLAPAAVFYFLYVLAIVVFAISPAVATGKWTTALMYGAFLGLVCYGTYDLTNHATLKAWTTTLTVIDMAWGAALTAFSASIGFIVARAVAGTP